MVSDFVFVSSDCMVKLSLHTFARFDGKVYVCCQKVFGFVWAFSNPLLIPSHGGGMERIPLLKIEKKSFF